MPATAPLPLPRRHGEWRSHVPLHHLRATRGRRPDTPPPTSTMVAMVDGAAQARPRGACIDCISTHEMISDDERHPLLCPPPPKKGKPSIPTQSPPSLLKMSAVYCNDQTPRSKRHNPVVLYILLPTCNRRGRRPLRLRGPCASMGAPSLGSAHTC